jgi:hypothetical protein
MSTLANDSKDCALPALRSHTEEVWPPGRELPAEREGLVHTLGIDRRHKTYGLQKVIVLPPCYLGLARAYLPSGHCEMLYFAHRSTPARARCISRCVRSLSSDTFGRGDVQVLEAKAVSWEQMEKPLLLARRGPAPATQKRLVSALLSPPGLRGRNSRSP